METPKTERTGLFCPWKMASPWCRSAKQTYLWVRQAGPSWMTGSGTQWVDYFDNNRQKLLVLLRQFSPFFNFFLSCSPGINKLEVSNQGKFVILEVDGSGGLVVGMQSKLTEHLLSSELRLAVGGILINKDQLIVQVPCFYFSWNTFTNWVMISWST